MGRGFLVSARNDGLRQGKKTSRPLREDDRAEQREAVCGQTCPIETAVGVPDRKD